MDFKLHSEYQPTGDQPQTIEALMKGFKEGKQFQTLLGVTGSGKTLNAEMDCMERAYRNIKNCRL